MIFYLLIIITMDLYNLVCENDQTYIAEKCDEYGINPNTLELPDYILDYGLRDMPNVSAITNMYIEDMMNKILQQEFECGNITLEDKNILWETIRTNCRDSRFDPSEDELNSLTQWARSLVEWF